MKKITLISISLVMILTNLTNTASATQPNTSVLTNAADSTFDSEKPIRLYLVKNENGFTMSLREEELDVPAKRNLIGSAKEVTYKGRVLQVETTIVMAGERTSTIDRYMPVGDDK
jgi:hypothetical protein